MTNSPEINEDNMRAWIQQGLDNGWISAPFCSTHDGAPYTLEESEEWDEGGDPCLWEIRIFPEGKPEDLTGGRENWNEWVANPAHSHA